MNMLMSAIIRHSGLGMYRIFYWMLFCNCVNSVFFFVRTARVALLRNMTHTNSRIRQGMQFFAIIAGSLPLMANGSSPAIFAR